MQLTHSEEKISTNRPPRRPAATGYSRSTLKVYCGCGFAAQTVAEGHDHSNATGHTLHITGEIRVA